MFSSKEIVRLKTVNQALQEQKISILADKNKAEQQKKIVVEMIDNFDYMKDNVFTLLRQIKNTLTY